MTIDDNEGEVSLERLLKRGQAPTAARSLTMAAIPSSNTSPEVVVRKALHAAGVRFRLKTRCLPCRPDVLIPGRKLAIFVHGCFWHQHDGCKAAKRPKSRTEFWDEKFRRNRLRDARDIDAVREAGWFPVVVWECETKSSIRLAEIVTETQSFRI